MITRRTEDKNNRRVLGGKSKCRFCKKDIDIDYKDLDLILRFVNMKGKITSRRINRNCARHQRKIAQAVKRGRFLALLPYQSR
jgi:small subunit ribosomal protein S18